MRTGVMVEGNLFESVLPPKRREKFAQAAAQVSPQGSQGKPREKIFNSRTSI